MAGSERILPELVYWNPFLIKDQFTQLNRHRYVSFDVDRGGLNNIRLVLEYVAVIAAITGRTLVLPPPQPWYLINNGPQHLGKQEGVTDIGEIFDISALRQAISVQTTQEFIAESAEHLSIPTDFQFEGIFDSQPDIWMRWQKWLFDNTVVPKGWNPYETVICYPDISSADTNSVSERYIDGRQFIEFTPQMNAAPVIHFPSNSQHRSLGPVATMLIGVDDRGPRLMRRLIKHHIRYRQEIFELASELVSSLTLYGYTALHIRRNDFQYKQTRTRANVIWNNVRDLLESDCPTYIATDEMDEGFRDTLRSNKTVFFWQDIMQHYAGPAIPEKYIGPIEQLICAGARRFIGTDLSTFSSYIARLRGYIRAPDTASYYHTESYSEPLEALDPDQFNGRSYLRENPLYWLDC